MNKPTLLTLCALIGLTFMLQACSTAKVRVMPGEKGVNKVVAKDIEQEGAEEAAIDAAREYCEKRNASFVVLKERTKYTGDMDESTRKTVRKASKTAQVLGGFNTPVSTAGRVGTSMTNDRDYKAEVFFKCKKSAVASN